MVKYEVTARLPEWCQRAYPGPEATFLTDEAKMGFVVDLLRKQLHEKSGGPFAAAIFDGVGRVVSLGVNRVVPGNNPTAHAEMMAFQLATTDLSTFSLSDKGQYTLVTSAQPCAMCFGATPWAGCSRIIIGATAEDTQQLTGFDEGAIHPDWRQELEKRGISVTEGILRKEVCELMSTYRSNGGTIYNGRTSDDALLKQLAIPDQERKSPAQTYAEKLDAAVSFLRRRLGSVPETLVILGSGLGDFAREVTTRQVVPYSEIPHMPVSATDGHAGNLIIGEIGSRPVALFQGRVHCHDGLESKDVAFGVRVMAKLGVKTLIVTNAAGGLRPGMEVGDLMPISSILTVFVSDPSFGISSPSLGDKFYPVTDPFDAQLISEFCQIAGQDSCAPGVYVMLPGPKYETRADVLALQRLGADAVGMSTVPEVLAFKHLLGAEGKVLGISVITNLAAGLSATEPNHTEVKVEGQRAAAKLQGFLRQLLGQ